MILRRVIQHFRQQEWTAIVLDFLIVVLGVFVGLQVQEWSAERAEAKQHARYYERLQADFSAINARIDGHLVVFNQSIESMDYVLGLVRMPEEALAVAEIDEARLQSALGDLGAKRIPPGRSATYSEMVAAGQLTEEILVLLKTEIAK